VNSHPHVSNLDLVIIHNGIIENYAPLKEELPKEAIYFLQTPIQKYWYLIEEVQKSEGLKVR
jgi:glucosamine--fructose-6-phosphate aminotransferase (isomerizing)